ncbi:MAG: FkbM family methyltransferase [Saprospiraceae bacterium]|nr:FkbM family methyltransferase [Saprospiraceae bacterium]
MILPTNIDFLSIDTEGMDLNILMTNDWDSLRPQLILAELKVDSLRLALESKMNQYLEQSNYRLVSKLYNTILFKRLD